MGFGPPDPVGCPTHPRPGSAQEAAGRPFLRIMQPTFHKHALCWLSCLGLFLAFTSLAASAAGDRKDVVILLDERLLTHLEATAEHLAVKEKTDRTLTRVFQACSNDKKVSGDTSSAFSQSIAARHPRLTAILAAEGWTPGDFYLTFYTLVSMPMASEFSRGGVPDTEEGIRRNVAFYERRKARVLALINKINPLLGTVPDKN